MKLFNPPVLGPDISYYQRVVGPEFNLPVFACRVHSGYREDSNFRANRDAINRNPHVKVKIAYVVPVKGMSIAAVVGLCQQIVPRDWLVMVDAESGAGFMGPGNNSAFFNALREALIRDWAGGNRRRVIGYANGGDWAGCWPQRGDVPMVVAKYSSSPSDLIASDQVIGWQYSDGDARWGVPNGYPRTASGIGNCDMNVWGFPSGDAFAAWVGGTQLSEEDDMTPELAARLDQMVAWQADRFQQVLNYVDQRINDLAGYTRDRVAEATTATTEAVSNVTTAPLVGAQVTLTGTIEGARQ